MTNIMPGLSEGLVTALFDVVRTFGRIVPETGHIFLATTMPRVMCVSIHADPAQRRIVLMASHDGFIDGDAYVQPLDDAKTHHLICDECLAAEDLERFVFTIDAIMRSYGGVTDNGTRCRVTEGVPDRLFARSVDVVFLTSEDVNMVSVPGDDDRQAEILRQQFDRPEDLAPFRDGFGNLFLCHVQWLPELMWRDAAMTRVCKRLGITSNDAFDQMKPYDRRVYERALEHELENPPS